MKINTKKELVIELLTKFPHLRDDDNRLIATIWKRELKTRDLTAIGFLQLYADKRLTNAESIVRCRRKVQELFPELRGSKYNVRHEHTKEVVNQLYNFI
jgi:hypothetical protein